MYDFRMLNFLTGHSPLVTIRLILIAASLTFAPFALAAPSDDVTAKELRVAVAECPPFVIVENGQYSGLAIYLWERIGREMGLNWKYTEYPLGSMLKP